jgi:hypothetical protein
MAQTTIAGSVGNAAKNDVNDVLFIKSLVFQIAPGVAGYLTPEERYNINQNSGACEAALVQALHRAQKMMLCGESPSGGRVMPGSNTLKGLIKNANAGLQATVIKNDEEEYEKARQGQAVLDKARAEQMGSIGVIHGTAGKPLSGSTDAAPSALAVTGVMVPTKLVIDLGKWLAGLIPRKTPFKITGGFGGQAGYFIYGAGGGFIDITNTKTHETRSFSMYFFAGGMSLAPVSFAYASPDMECGAVSHLYKGAFCPLPSMMQSFEGPFVALSAGVASPTESPGGLSITLYFFGLNYLDLTAGVTGVSPKWEVLQKAAGIGVGWGSSSSVPDGDVQVQLGKLTLS